MFFLIRCVFWLTVVFSTIFNADQNRATAVRQPEPARQAQELRQGRAGDDGGSATDLSHRLQAFVSAELQRFWVKTTRGCAETPTECADLAARLSDFARQHPFSEQAKPERGVQMAAMPVAAAMPSGRAGAVADVPLPPLRPQHIHRSAEAPRGRAAGS
jgi:hypothetical protein